MGKRDDSAIADTLTTPRMSAVLAVDAFATGAACVAALRSQTIAAELELVLVGPVLTLPEGVADGLHSVRLVDHECRELAEARAAGILEARAPLVFVAETHAMPDPPCLELLAGALDAGADAAMPRSGCATA